MVRLVDIAKNVGVSAATVSYVLGGSGEARRIPEATCAQILAEAKRLGYRKNALGVQLRKGHTRQLAFLSHSPTVEYVYSIFSGMTEEAVKHNYSCRMHSLDPVLSVSDAKVRKFYTSILETRPEAVVIHCIMPLFHEFVANCHDMNILVCVVENMAFQDADLLVYSDSADGEIQAVDYLISRGHKEIAYVTTSHTYAEPMKRGFLTGLAKHNLPFDTRRMLIYDEPFHGTELEPWLSSLKKSGILPTAVCCCTDYLAANMLIVALKLGLRVPEDISIIGFGGLSFTKHLSPNITTVQKNYVLIGGTAAEKIIGLLSGKKIGQTTFSVPCNIQNYETVAALNRKIESKLTINELPRCRARGGSGKCEQC